MFDAELYLRLVGERLLAEGSNHHHHGPTPLTSAAQALIAAGVVEPPTARAVLADYQLAAAVRGDQMALWAMQADDEDEEAPAPVEPLPPARTVVCDHTIETAQGTVQIHLATLSEDETLLAATVRFAARSRRLRGGHRLTMHGSMGPPSVTLADDRGTKRTAHFGGGGSEHEWTGHFSAEPGLAVDTAYIDLDGERIELAGDVAPAEVWIEDLPPAEPALAYLWANLTHDDMHEETPLEPAIDALVAAGALAADDPALEDIRAVAGARRGLMYGGGRSSKRLPEPWRSVLRSSRRTGPSGTIAVNAATPVFDGHAVAISSLTSTQQAWEVSAEVAPGEWDGPFSSGLRDSPGLTWWARDERGNDYLGSIGSWSSGERSGRGEVAFGPALDRKAAYVDLLPTGPTQRAVIRIGLEWSR